HIQVFFILFIFLEFFASVLPMGFPFPKFAFLACRISGFILRKERAVYIINSYYMKISLTRPFNKSKDFDAEFLSIPNL
ncbi:MAG TPA: hypothetical protein VFM18_02825, partial [Methanosarcina sp.]|nr:hypothetical protein [Methanosarcina sp.]